MSNQFASYYGMKLMVLGFKFLSILVGALLIAPIAWAFWVMLIRGEAADERAKVAVKGREFQIQKQLDSAPEGMMIAVVRVEMMVTPYAFLSRTCGLYPRRWVGISGLAACAFLFGLWVLSACWPSNCYSSTLTSSNPWPTEGHPSPDRSSWINFPQPKPNDAPPAEAPPK